MQLQSGPDERIRPEPPGKSSDPALAAPLVALRERVLTIAEADRRLSRGDGLTTISNPGAATALESAIRKLDWKPHGTEWAEYYQGDSYTEASNEHKKSVVSDYLDALAPREVWDLGANVGEFSRIASDRGIRTLAFDSDPACVERNYRRIRESGETNLLPLVLEELSSAPAPRSIEPSSVEPSPVE